jgi:hypothetical protein
MSDLAYAEMEPQSSSIFNNILSVTMKLDSSCLHLGEDGLLGFALEWRVPTQEDVQYDST